VFGVERERGGCAWVNPEVVPSSPISIDPGTLHGQKPGARTLAARPALLPIVPQRAHSMTTALLNEEHRERLLVVAGRANEESHRQDPRACRSGYTSGCLRPRQRGAISPRPGATAPHFVDAWSRSPMMRHSRGRRCERTGVLFARLRRAAQFVRPAVRSGAIMESCSISDLGGGPRDQRRPAVDHADATVQCRGFCAFSPSALVVAL
jgi:hypothetical protein